MPPNGHFSIRAKTVSYRGGDSEPNHSHHEHQLVYANTGLLCVDTPDARWVVPPLRAVWIPAETPHAITARTESEMAALYLDQAITGDGLDSVTVISVTPLLRELIAHMLQITSEPAERARFEAVFVDQLRAAPRAPLELPRIHNPLIRTIADALEQNPRDSRTLADFGREVGAHERTLQRLFTSETGTTFGRWRTQLRLQHGVIALGQGHTVTSAATSSGYREPSAFIAAFRVAFGTTPGRYFDH